MAIAIAIEQVVKAFPGASSPAVDRVALRIEPGELFFLLGPSGCGKTTLLRMIAGFIEPDAGRILFSAPSGALTDVTYLPPNRRNTGMVFQSYALWPHMTVEANVAFGLQVRRVPAQERARLVGAALDAVRMRDYAQRKPNQLSGGQQQRVALARALVIRPSVLLLDEPLSNLDARLRIELRSEIRRICKESGITTVYVTHDQKEALSMADRVAVLDRGRVVQVGPPRELYRRPATRFVAEFLGETNLLPARLVGPAGSGATVETPVGTLVSAVPPPPGTDLLCSIRPEALRVADGAHAENRIRGRVVETTYLGELAQLTLEVGTVRLRAAHLNPAAGDLAGHDAAMTVSPDDVILLPAG